VSFAQAEGGGFGCEQLHQMLSRSGDPRAYGSNWASDDLGDIAVRKSLNVAHDNRRAHIFRQPAQGFFNGRSRQARERGPFELQRGLVRCRRFFEFTFYQHQFRPGVGRATLRNEAVAHDPEQPHLVQAARLSSWSACSKACK